MFGVSKQYNMDDSRLALSKACNAVCERYKKLRLQHRQLLRDRTCPRCQQQRHVCVGMGDSADGQTTSILSQRSPSDANEIHEICDHLKQLAEAGQISDGSFIIHSIIPRLQNVASRLATNTTFDDRQDSLFNASASEVSSSLSTLSRLQLEALAADLLQSQQLRIVPNMVGTTEDLAPSTTCEMSGDSDQQDTDLIAGTAPWLSDLQEAEEMVTSQNLEMKKFCQHLKQQNESLSTLVKQLVSTKDVRAVCDLGNADLADNDWSLIDKQIA